MAEAVSVLVHLGLLILAAVIMIEAARFNLDEGPVPFFSLRICDYIDIDPGIVAVVTMTMNANAMIGMRVIVIDEYGWRAG